MQKDSESDLKLVKHFTRPDFLAKNFSHKKRVDDFFANNKTV